MSLRDLIDRWRSDAELFRRRGAAEAAATLEDCAGELEREFRAWWEEELTTTAAAAESGYSEARLRELVREGGLRATRRGRTIYVRRCDLPKHAVAPNHPAVIALTSRARGAH